MHVRFVGQPYIDSGGWSYDVIGGMLTEESFDRFFVVSAWVKRSGLGRLQELMSGFSNRGGQSTAILGIDHNGATIQGLEMVVELFDEVLVFHEPGSRTFHPKVYIGVGPSTAHILIGSSNLTAGGLFHNYESNLFIVTDLTNAEDRDFLNGLLDWIALLRGDSEVCLQLTPAVIEQLLTDGRYGITDEDSRRHVGEEDTDSDVGDQPGPSQFGRSRVRKRRLAPRLSAVRTVDQDDSSPPSEVFLSSDIERRWTKRLTRSEAMNVNPGSNPTANIRLTQAGHPIDQTSYFRQDFFGSANWEQRRSQGRDVEQATVVFDVVIEGRTFGNLPLEVVHAAHREAGQNNAPTWIRWGSLTPTIRSRNLAGQWLILQRLVDGTFRMEVTPG